MTQGPTLYEAKVALNENLGAFTSESGKGIYNLTVALSAICSALERLSRDVDLLHNKLQPILKTLAEDENDYRNPQP